jgi:methylene-fatty-acyl-phospholipid synthase
MSLPSFDITKFPSYVSLDHLNSTDNLIYLAIMSIPHIYYFWIWVNPSAFTRTTRALNQKDPVAFLANSATLIKFLQFGMGIFWSMNHGVIPNPMDNMKTLVLGGVFFLIGQILNIAVYQTLGRNGVYYGSRLGQPCPWVTGFPFNTVPHPQYVGSVLTLWGLTILFATDSHISSGLITLQLIWTAYYFITGVYEQYL